MTAQPGGDCAVSLLDDSADAEQRIVAMSTLRHRGSDADVCRANGWGVGTFLAGDEGHGVTVIELTALGRQSIVARCVAHDGQAVNQGENSWVLWCREWTAIPAEDVPQPLPIGEPATLVLRVPEIPESLACVCGGVPGLNPAIVLPPRYRHLAISPKQLRAYAEYVADSEATDLA